MPRGGKRPGAGGPKGFDKVESQRRLQEKVWASQDRMTDAQIAAAEGVKYLMARKKQGGKFVPVTEELAKAVASGNDKEHEVMEVWEKQPNTQAYAYLMDQTIGKAKNVIEAEVNVGASADLMALLQEGRERVAKLKAKK